MSDSSIGARFRTARERKGMTAKDLSVASGVPEATIYRIETGEVSNPKLSSIIPLIKALEISADHLLMDRRDMGLSGVLERQFRTINKWSPQDKFDLAKILEKLILAGYLKSVLDHRDDPFALEAFEDHIHDQDREFEEALEVELEARHEERLYKEHVDSTG